MTRAGRVPMAPLLALATGAIALGVGLMGLLNGEDGVTVRYTQTSLPEKIPITLFGPQSSEADRVRRADAPLPERVPVVVIGHGFAGSRQLMAPMAVSLARNGYIALTFDFPGHGANPKPLEGRLGDEERRDALSEALETVLAYARSLPEGDGRVALLGHSMAGDILVRQAQSDRDIQAVVAVSPYLSAVPTADDRASNLLFVYGGWEPSLIHDQGRAAVAAAGGRPPGEVELGKTYGTHVDGSARRLVIADGVEHIGVLYSETALRAAVQWLDDVFGSENPIEPRPVDTRGPWLGLFFLGVVVLAWPLSRLLPAVTAFPLGAGLRGRRLALAAVLPPVLTPLLLWPVPTDFLPIAIGDYLAAHFALYGLLTFGTLWASGASGSEPVRTLPNRGAFLGAILAVVMYQLLCVSLPVHRFVAAFLPGPERLVVVLVLVIGTLLWSSADEWLTRGEGAGRGLYWLTKVLFVFSLMLAVALNLGELFFLVIIIPAIVVLLVVQGLFSGWIYRRVGHPWVAAAANALAFALPVAATFPMLG